MVFFFLLFLFYLFCLLMWCIPLDFSLPCHFFLDDNMRRKKNNRVQATTSTLKRKRKKACWTLLDKFRRRAQWQDMKLEAHQADIEGGHQFELFCYNICFFVDALRRPDEQHRLLSSKTLKYFYQFFTFIIITLTFTTTIARRSRM